MAEFRTLTLQDYWRILYRRKWLILLAVLVVFSATFVYTNLQTPLYEATATIKIEPKVTVPGVSTDQSGWDIYFMLATEVKVIKSAQIAERVAKKLNLIDDTTPLEKRQQIISYIQSKTNAERVGDSNLINIIARSSKPEEAAELANATASAYIEKGAEDMSRRARELRQFIESQLLDAEQKLRAAENQLKEYTERTGAKGIGGFLASRLVDLETKKQDLLKTYTEKHPEVQKITSQINIIQQQMKQLPEEELGYARLAREVKLNEELYTLLAKRFKEAQISEADRAQNAFIVSTANVPQSPIYPRKFANLTIGGLLGLFLGFILALVSESMDTTISTLEDVEEFLKLPVLGIIPHADVPKEFLDKPQRFRSRGLLLPYHSAKSAFVESYHTLRANFQFATRKIPKVSSVLFTSSGVGEGKTISAANFAFSAAQAGQKVVLIEGDLRRPYLHNLFGIPIAPGLSEIITGMNCNEAMCSVTDYIIANISQDNILEKLIQTPGIENLRVIPCGKIPANPVDLLNSPELRNLLNELASHFDVIVIDSPPVLLFADALILSTVIQSTVLVCQIGKIPRSALKRSVDQLTNVKANVVGVVLNDIQIAEMASYLGYHYGYHYKSYSAPGSKKE